MWRQNGRQFEERVSMFQMHGQFLYGVHIVLPVKPQRMGEGMQIAEFLQMPIKDNGVNDILYLSFIYYYLII